MREYDIQSSEGLCDKENPEPEGPENNLKKDEISLHEEKEIEKEIEEYKTENEDEDNWEGSESEVIADDEAEIYEEPYTGIKIDYSLTFEEALSCLKKFNQDKSKNKRFGIESVILLFVGLFCFISYFLNFDIINLILGVMSVALICIIYSIPSISLRNKAKEMVLESPDYIEFYPDNIVFGKNDVEQEIMLDGSSYFKEFDDLFIIFSPKNTMLIIPIRSLEPDIVPDIHALISAGTSPVYED